MNKKVLFTLALFVPFAQSNAGLFTKTIVNKQGLSARCADVAKNSGTTLKNVAYKCADCSVKAGKYSAGTLKNVSIKCADVAKNSGAILKNVAYKCADCSIKTGKTAANKTVTFVKGHPYKTAGITAGLITVVGATKVLKTKKSDKNVVAPVVETVVEQPVVETVVEQPVRVSIADIFGNAKNTRLSPIVAKHCLNPLTVKTNSFFYLDFTGYGATNKLIGLMQAFDAARGSDKELEIAMDIVNELNSINNKPAVCSKSCKSCR